MAKNASGTRRAPLARSLPLGYLGAAILLAAVLLPTSLRPPQDQQSTSAAFSPDAPPEDTPPEALLQSLRQARSSTAGAAVDQSVEVREQQELAEEELPPPPPPPPPPRKRAARNGCFGDPPRQTESLYSALCVPAFTGESNGGRTSMGVDENTIRVAVTVPLDSEVPDGPLEREFRDTDIRDTHDLKVLQAYFNDRFEFYRRYLQLVIVKQSTTNETQQRESVVTAHSQDVFAMIGNAAAAVREAIRLKIVDFGSGNNPVPFYNDAFPYAFSFTMDSWQTRYMGTELICKHYAGKPPGELNEKMDPTFNYEEPRTWGLVSYQDTTRTGATDQIRDLLKRCGVELKLAQEYNITSGQQGLAGVMAKFKAAGVTTVILNVDGLTPTLLTEEADRAQYWPEYVHTGTGEMDSNDSGRLMNDRQARHVVGLSPNEIARPDEDKDWYRAYKEVDPEGSPEDDIASEFRSLQQLAGGIQHAGPNLTPLTLWDGLRKQPYRTPDPVWSIGGGYRDSLEFVAYKDLTYEDFMTLIWFDQTADDPASTFTGAWCHMHLGRRYKVGGLPTEPLPFRDPSQCMVTPPRGEQG